MKRGVSPLVGWILIVGFAVAMGSLILMWSTGLISDLNIGKGEKTELYCDNIKLKVESVCIGDNDELKIDLKNVGQRNIAAFTFSRETSNKATSYCIELDPLKMEVGLEQPLEFKISFDKKDINSEQECKTFTPSGNTPSGVKLYMISFVPWIELDGEKVVCTEKEVKLDSGKGQNGEVFNFLNKKCYGGGPG